MEKMEFIPYNAHECIEHLYYQIPMELFFNKKYKDNLNSDSKILYGFDSVKWFRNRKKESPLI